MLEFGVIRLLGCNLPHYLLSSIDNDMHTEDYYSPDFRVDYLTDSLKTFYNKSISQVQY